MKKIFKIIMLLFIFCIGCANDVLVNDINVSSVNKYSDKKETPAKFKLKKTSNKAKAFNDHGNKENRFKSILDEQYVVVNKHKKTKRDNINNKKNTSIKNDNYVNNNTFLKNEENKVSVFKPILDEQYVIVKKYEKVKKNKQVNNTFLKNEEYKESQFKTETVLAIKNSDSISNILEYKTNNFKIKQLRAKESYKTDAQHTVLLQIENLGEKINDLKLDALLPSGWKLISVSNIGLLNKNEKKIAFVSFFIPANGKAGMSNTKFIVKNKLNTILQSFIISFKVAENYDLEVFNVFSSQSLQAGETIKESFIIKNKGNIKQEISLSSRNNINGIKNLSITPDSTIIVDVNQITNSKIYTLRNVNINLNVFSKASNKTYRAYSTVKVFPTKIKQEDPYFRYPIRASMYYNSYTNKQEHYSTLSSEVTGNGYLDVAKKHYLNFVVRAPEQNNLKRFGVTDQYSLIYKFKNKTTLFLGDHGYYINRLSFNSRYGMGARLDQEIDKWKLSLFYSKPRLYDYNAEALYGAKAIYKASDSLSLGVSLARSKGVNQVINPNITDSSDEEGQILTFNFDYKNRGTLLKTESSTSITNKNIDYANFINLLQRFNNFTYNGNFTISGKNYFGTLSNSLLFSNSLGYKSNNWSFNFGQSLSKVNRRLNPLFYAAEPYSENYFGSIGYRLNRSHYFDVRFDKRIREDQLEPKNYHYKEYGLNYRYSYLKQQLSINFNGRIGKTQNLLSQSLSYRNTYAHSLNVSYRAYNSLNLKGSISHNYTNRYGQNNYNSNYVRYNLGFNYRLNKNLLFSGNYNSGFSPEDTYLKREFINAKIVARTSKNHEFQIRANYFKNPGSSNDKELLVFGKYTYSFGAPMKKMFEQGGVKGYIFTSDKSIDVKGIKIIAAGKTVQTDKNGQFELNNLTLGTNYILLDESTLPEGIVVSQKNPYKVVVTEKNKKDLQINLVKAANIYGKFVFDKLENVTKNYNLEGYIKIENENFTYHTKSNSKGEFSFKQIVPGTYKVTLLRLKQNKKLLNTSKNILLTVKQGGVKRFNYGLKIKRRKIKFKNKSFKVGE